MKSDVDFDESVWCELNLHNKDKLIIGCIYRSPENDVQNVNKLLVQMNEMYIKGYSHFLNLGDFNFPDIDWATQSSNRSINHISSKFIEGIKD